MKVLFVINSLGAGGAERSLAETIVHLAPEIDPLVLCLDRCDEGVLDQVRRYGLEVRVAPGHFLEQIRYLRRTIVLERPDALHTSLFEADVAGRLAAVGYHLPVVTSLVNTSYEPVRRSDPLVSAGRLRAVQAIDGWTARHLTTHFHAITCAVRDAAVRDLGISADDVTVIERGRDPLRLGEPNAARRARARESLGLAPDTLVLATLGRQEFQKGQWHLLEAMPKVLADLPQATLLLAGRAGNASDRLRKATEQAGVQAHVRFLGHRDDAPEVLAAADLFVFPSLYEGLGGSLIEAMALGLPIVASDLPAIREVVEPGVNALLVPPGSPSDLANAILTLAADRDRRATMGARGRAVFLERFTLERSARRMLELFEQVAAEGRHPGR